MKIFLYFKCFDGGIFFQREMRKLKSDFIFFSQRNTLGRNCLSAYLLIFIKKFCLKKTPP